MTKISQNHQDRQITLGYDPRTDAILDQISGELTQADFARLALACCDQAGLAAANQATVAALLAPLLATDNDCGCTLCHYARKHPQTGARGCHD